MFFSWVGPRSVTLRSSRPLTCQYACSERQIAPGLAIPSSRAAILTPSPIRSPSLSSTTSPRVDADAELDALVRRDLGVALDHRPLDFNGAVHCVHDAAELDDTAVARALDYAAVMHRDSRVDQIAPKGPKASERTVLVGSRKPRIADHVGHQDRGQFSGLAHGATPPRPCQPFRVVRAKPLEAIAKTRQECRSLA